LRCHAKVGEHGIEHYCHANLSGCTIQVLFQGYFFLRRTFFLLFLTDLVALLSTKKSSRLAPALMAAVIHRGWAPLPVQVLPT
jgi:hypothetical protein